MQPVILLSGANQSRANYEAAVAAAGGLPRSCYLPEVSSQGYAGLVLCGGDDMEPSRYGQENAGSGGIDPRRDEVELALIDCFLSAGKPIFGICRGLQVLNVAFGGALTQDLPDSIRARHTSGGQGDLLHPAPTRPGSFLRRLYGAVPVVNSSHHQAVSRLGQGLEAVQWSEDGCVEGLVHPAKPHWAVQWHPERLCLSHARPDAADGLAVFRFFLAACGG